MILRYIFDYICSHVECSITENHPDWKAYWLGATRHTDGHFYWFNGRQVISNYIWGIGEPNNAHDHDENCLQFLHYAQPYPEEKKNALNDNHCDFRGYFICEGRLLYKTTICMYIIIASNRAVTRLPVFCENERSRWLFSYLPWPIMSDLSRNA